MTPRELYCKAMSTAFLCRVQSEVNLPHVEEPNQELCNKKAKYDIIRMHSDILGRKVEVQREGGTYTSEMYILTSKEMASIVDIIKEIVEICEYEAEPQEHDPIKVLEFAMTCDEPQEFIRCWMHGEFDILASEWGFSG